MKNTWNYPSLSKLTVKFQPCFLVLKVSFVQKWSFFISCSKYFCFHVCMIQSCDFLIDCLTMHTFEFCFVYNFVKSIASFPWDTVTGKVYCFINFCYIYFSIFRRFLYLTFSIFILRPGHEQNNLHASTTSQNLYLWQWCEITMQS